MRYNGHAGFHAGNHAWAVFQEAPGQQYQSRLLKISLISRCGDKITYQLPPLDLGLNLPVYCTVFGGINVLAVLADSKIVAGAIKKEALANAEGFRKTIIKLCIVEFLAVCGLLASTLLIIYQNT